MSKAKEFIKLCEKSVGEKEAGAWVQTANQKAAEMLADGKIDKAKHDLIVKENQKNYKKRLADLKKK